MRWFLWVDLDAYYVSCELRDRPDLLGRPVIVGPDPREGPSRGVVLSASYEARAQGVHSAMPVAQAGRLSPEATWIRPDHAKYERISEEVRALLRTKYPFLRPQSIDEVIVEFEAEAPEQVDSEARALQTMIGTRANLPASVGASTYRIVAKIASDRAKPAGVRVVPPAEVAAFLAPLPVRAIPGVGPKTEALLRDHQVETIGQMAPGLPPALRRMLGSFAREIVALARGQPVEVEPDEETGPRSRSVDRTFDEDVGNADELSSAAIELARLLGDSLEREGLMFRSVSVAVRWEDFQRVQRGRTLPAYQHGPAALQLVAPRLVRELWSEERRGRRRRARLVSVRAERLRPAPSGQRDLDDFARPPED
jgi:DNA polymerase-4